MVRAVDPKAIERATDDASDGSKSNRRGGPGSNRRSDRMCERWIMEL